MIILALDPSSTCVGYAALRGLSAGDLIEAGRLRPSMAVKALEGIPDWQMEHLRQPELKAAWRVTTLCRDALALVNEIKPERIVIEIPSGLYGAGAKQGARGSLTTYGMAAGAIWATLELHRPGAVAPVTERQWTKQRGNKMAHQMAMAGLYTGYNPADDQGADISDAIGLARWWINKMSVAI